MLAKMASEQEDRIQYIPAKNRGIWKFSDYLAALLERPGRFNSVLSRTERISVSFLQKLSGALGIGGGWYLPGSPSPIPPAWQLLLQYLKREGVLADPNVQFVKIWNDAPKICRIGLVPAQPEGKTDGVIPQEKPHGYFAKGVSRDFEEALSKAVGELLERYTLLIYRQNDLTPASVRSLRKKGVHFLDPFLAAGFSEEQKKKYPERNFTEDSIFYWARGISVTKNRPALIPAQFALWNYRPMPGEPILQQRTTNGAAGGFTSEEATLAGLYELIQRDAFLYYWLRGESPPRIDTKTFTHPTLQKAIHDFERYGLQLEIMNITSDIGVPAFVAAALDDSKLAPPVAIGASCGGGDIEKVVLGAVNEAHTLLYAYRNGYLKLLEENGFFPLPEEPFSQPHTLDDRALLWKNPEMKKHFDFFLQGPPKPLSSVLPNNETLSQLARRLGERGAEYEVFAYYAAHPVLAKVGYAAAKVSVPAIIPLHLDERYAALGAKRMGAAPKLNPIPHPFP